MAVQTPSTDTGASTQPITISTDATGARQPIRRFRVSMSPLDAKVGHLGAKTFQLSSLVLAEVRVAHRVTVPELQLLHVTRLG